MVNKYSCCIYINYQTKFNETRLFFFVKLGFFCCCCCCFVIIFARNEVWMLNSFSFLKYLAMSL